MLIDIGIITAVYIFCLILWKEATSDRSYFKHLTDVVE